MKTSLLKVWDCRISERRDNSGMGKILGSWSAMRNYLEDEMIAETLRGRIRYNCTAYVGMDGDRVFEPAQ